MQSKHFDTWSGGILCVAPTMVTRQRRGRAQVRDHRMLGICSSRLQLPGHAVSYGVGNAFGRHLPAVCVGAPRFLWTMMCQNREVLKQVSGKIIFGMTSLYYVGT